MINASVTSYLKEYFNIFVLFIPKLGSVEMETLKMFLSSCFGSTFA